MQASDSQFVALDDDSGLRVNATHEYIPPVLKLVHVGAHQLEKIIAVTPGTGCKPGYSRYVGSCDRCDAVIDTFKVPQKTKDMSLQRVNHKPGEMFFIDGMYPTVVSKWGGAQVRPGGHLREVIIRGAVLHARPVSEVVCRLHSLSRHVGASADEVDIADVVRRLLAGSDERVRVSWASAQARPPLPVMSHLCRWDITLRIKTRPVTYFPHAASAAHENCISPVPSALSVKQ